MCFKDSGQYSRYENQNVSQFMVKLLHHQELEKKEELEYAKELCENVSEALLKNNLKKN